MHFGCLPHLSLSRKETAMEDDMANMFIIPEDVLVSLIEATVELHFLEIQDCIPGVSREQFDQALTTVFEKVTNIEEGEEEFDIKEEIERELQRIMAV